MSEAADLLLRHGPLIVLAVTAAWLAIATRRTSSLIGVRAYGFGASLRQRLARLLFAGSIVGAAVALGAHALGFASAFLSPLVGETAVIRLAGLALAVAGSGLTLFAQGDMGWRWRVGVPETAPDALVTTGLFGLSRNPVFLGMLAMAVCGRGAFPGDDRLRGRLLDRVRDPDPGRGAVPPTLVRPRLSRLPRRRPALDLTTNGRLNR